MKKIRKREDNINNEERVSYFEWLELADVEQVILYQTHALTFLNTMLTGKRIKRSQFIHHLTKK